MKGSRPSAVLTGVVAAAVLCACAQASGGSWQTFTDPAYHVRVAVPASWFVVPPNVADVDADIAKLDKEKQTGVAAVYRHLIATPAAVTQLKRYFFEAFQYEPKAAIQPDYAITLTITPKPETLAQLTQIVDSEPAQLKTVSGTVITKAAVITLPSGRAAAIEGTQPDGSLTTRFAIFVVAHGQFLYDLSFRADATMAGEAAVFTSIADRLAFT